MDCVLGIKATRAPAMAALLPPSSAAAATNLAFSLNLRLESNFTPKSIEFSDLPRPQTSTLYKPVSNLFPNPKRNRLNARFSAAKLSVNSQSTARFVAAASPSMADTDTIVSARCSHWMVLTERPTDEILKSREELMKYYVDILQRVLGSEKDPQSCIYDVSYDTQFGFCCDIDEETSKALAGLPGILLVKPDPDRNSGGKDYSAYEAILKSSIQSANGETLLFPTGSSKHWLVRMDNPNIGVVTKAQMVDFYVETLTKVLGNEKDAQMCIYNVSWQSNFGFCCELDEESATELAGIPGVLSVQSDNNLGSENKDYRGDAQLKSSQSVEPPDAVEMINPKKLFITGLSFYTSEKTLRAAFEPFGELVEVKVIMDKISKRSKGYAFVAYKTEEAANTALQEMNGKIINGWMITVDMAKSKPRYSRRPLA